MYGPEELMQLAIAKAREGIRSGQSPFGCAIALGDRLLACEHNRVLLDTDVTAHAEITALRAACRIAGNVLLEGAIVATTCEPCPMCAAALHWARVDRIYYGATIADASVAGFNELALAAQDVFDCGQNIVQLVPGVAAEECRELFTQWLKTPGHQAY